MFDEKKLSRLLDYVIKVQALKNIYTPDLSLAQYAIRFCLSHPAIGTVITGMRKPGQVFHNIKSINKGVCSELELDELRAFAGVRTLIMRDEKSILKVIKRGIKRYILRR